MGEVITKVIHIKDAKGGDDEVYIGRAGQGKDGYFGNPVSIKEKCPVCGKMHSVPGQTLICYGIYLDKRLEEDPEFKKRIMELRGKTLICFCKHRPNKRCHGDYIVNRINKLYKLSFQW